MNARLLSAGALALASGAAGLAHQVLWTRRLVDAVGANADTFSKVLGAFFLGLALGAWLTSRPQGNLVNGWRRVALIEVVVAGFALPAMFSAEIATIVQRTPVPGPAIKLLLPLLFVTPPAIAMGMVVPWMVRAQVASAGFQPRHAIWLYALNTLGGLVGLGWILLEALPRLGLLGASASAIGINLSVAAGAWFLGGKRLEVADVDWGREPSHEPDRGSGEPGFSSRRGTLGDQDHGRHRRHGKKELTRSSQFLFRVFSVFRGSLPRFSSCRVHGNLLAGKDAGAPRFMAGGEYALAFASGGLVLALEVVLQHQVAQVAINSLFSSALVLAVVLVALASAALLLPLLVRKFEEGTLVRGAILAAAVLGAVEPFLFTSARRGLEIFPYELSPGPYLWQVASLVAGVAGPMLLAAGLLFPLLLRRAARERDARRIGLLFFWNGLGGWLGAELAQARLAPALGLWGSMSLIAGAYALCALPWSWRNLKLPRFILPAGALVFVAASGWAARSLPQASVAPAERLAAVQVGREGVVATIECGPGDWRMLFNNSYTLGGSKAQFNQERQGLLPVLLHGHARSVAALGVATGGTVAGAALCPEVGSIDAVELSPLVLRYANEFFTPFNRDVFRDPRVRFIQDDARWVMARQRGAYDVVIGDLFLPWRTGEARLFTREHFQNVFHSLRPDGLFCQWLPLFQLTRPQFDAIARTFREVFPDAFVVRGDFYSELPIVGLVGGRRLQELPWPRIASLCERVRREANVQDPLARHAEGVAMLMLGPLPEPPPGPVNTLARAWLEWDAGKNILGLRLPWFIGVPEAEYVRELHRAGQTLLPSEYIAAHDAGQFFLTLEIAARLKLPALTDLTAQIPQRMPAALREDAGADWRQWPMRIKPTFGSSSASP